jgi:hypothetical protein
MLTAINSRCQQQYLVAVVMRFNVLLTIKKSFVDGSSILASWAINSGRIKNNNFDPLPHVGRSDMQLLAAGGQDGSHCWDDLQLEQLFTGHDFIHPFAGG